MTELLEAGPTQRRRPRLTVVVGAVVAVVVLIVWLVAFSPVLAARHVKVSGDLSSVSAEQIRAAAQVPHTPLIRLDAAAISKRLEALPGVASVHVSASYPSTVSIVVNSRLAVGYLSLPSGVALVDKTGKQFSTRAVAPAQLPHFELAPGADPQPSTEAAALVAGALPKSILGQLLTISAGSPTAVELVLRDGRIVRWGAPDRNAEKVQLLTVLLARPGNTFDLSDPNSVVVS